MKRGGGYQLQTRLSQPKIIVLEKKFPKPLVVKTSMYYSWVGWVLLEAQVFLFKRPYGQTYSDSLILSSITGVAAWEVSRTYWGVMEVGRERFWIVVFRTRAGEAAYSQTEMLTEAIVPLLGPPPTKPTGRWHICVSIKLANTIHPAQVIPWVPTQCAMSWLILQTLLPSLQDSQVTSKQQLTSQCPVTLAKCPQAWY